MIKGIGVDIVETERIKRVRESFFRRMYTSNELKLFHSTNFNTMAGNFAVKEAVSKALGTGFRGFSPKDIEVLRDNMGKPYVNLFGKALERFKEIEGTNITVSVSHEKSYAVGMAVIE